MDRVYDLRLFSDRVLIRSEIIEPGSRLYGGLIFIPDNAEQEFQYGEIVGVGERLDQFGRRASSLVSVGDTVLFSKYSGTEVMFDGVNYLMVPESDLLACVEE